MQGKPLSIQEATLHRAISVDPGSAQARRYLAHVLLLQDQLDEAAASAKVATNARPDYAAAHFTLGAVYFSKGLKQFAKDELQEATRLGPDSPEPYSALGIVLGALGKPEEATWSLKKATELAPYDAMIRAELGRRYLNHGEPDKAAAEEAFRDWSDPKAAITCQDYTLMFRSKVTY